MLSDESAALLLRIAAIAGELPADQSLAFFEECIYLLEASIAAGERVPGVVLGPMLARHGSRMGART